MFMQVTWTARWPGLNPEFVLATGSAARSLAMKLLNDPARLSTLRGVVSGDSLALTGDELPWVDGAEYFGRERDTPWLLVPTTHAPSIPASWLEHAYRARVPEVRWPCLLRRVGDELSLLPVGNAAALDPVRLEAWCRRG
jgi:hypothetical protein